MVVEFKTLTVGILVIRAVLIKYPAMELAEPLNVTKHFATLVTADTVTSIYFASSPVPLLKELVETNPV